MMTSSTFSPVACSASALSARSTSADRSSGRYCTPASASFCPVPIRRLNEAALRFGCVTRRSRAVAPTSRLPSASTDTADGVSMLPCTLGMGVGTPSLSQAMRLLVVPRSMPKITVSLQDAARGAVDARPSRRRFYWQRSVGLVDGGQFVQPLLQEASVGRLAREGQGAPVGPAGLVRLLQATVHVGERRMRHGVSVQVALRHRVA